MYFRQVYLQDGYWPRQAWKTHRQPEDRPDDPYRRDYAPEKKPHRQAAHQSWACLRVPAAARYHHCLGVRCWDAQTTDEHCRVDLEDRRALRNCHQPSAHGWADWDSKDSRSCRPHDAVHGCRYHRAKHRHRGAGMMAWHRTCAADGLRHRADAG
jgi:hypothetical protein